MCTSSTAAAQGGTRHTAAIRRTSADSSTTSRNSCNTSAANEHGFRYLCAASRGAENSRPAYRTASRTSSTASCYSVRVWRRRSRRRLPVELRIAIARVFRPWKFFPIPLNEPELFTASEHWQKYIDTDPHGLRFATSRFLFSSFSLDIYLKRAAKRVKVPTFLALAEHDRIIDNTKTSEFVGGFPRPCGINHLRRGTSHAGI